MTAEEILKSNVQPNYIWQEHHRNTAIEKAMQEYADQQSVELLEWYRDRMAPPHNAKEALQEFKSKNQVGEQTK